MATKRELIGLSYSPWSEKARWALDHHGLSYTWTEHIPMLGEPALRLKTKSATGRATVPVLITPHGPVTDSFRIAELAERHGKGAPLFPQENYDDIAAWNARSERALDAARGLVVARTGRSPKAQEEALPAFVPAFLRPTLRPVATLGVAFFNRKYTLSQADEAERRATVAAELLALRNVVDNRDYLVGGRFTYADIAMAVSLQFLGPHPSLHLGEGTTEAWRDPDLAARFGGLLAWRDAIYDKHRGTRGG
jgi:glutathione S-transferase